MFRIARSVAGLPDDRERGPLEDRGPDREETETGDDDTGAESGQAGPPEDPDPGDGADDSDVETEADEENGSDGAPGTSGAGNFG